MSAEMNRRDFIRRTGVSGAGLALSGVGAARQLLGASDMVRIGVIGTGRQGRGDLQAFAKQPDAQVVAIADVYEPNLNKAREALLKSTDKQVEVYKDFRQILDRKDIDAVIVATPDHWHALPAVEACKAGKDVYVEKPVSTVVEEGRTIVEAARKYRRVVQVGTQQRSGIHFQKAVALVQDGFLGKISFVRTWNYSNEYPEGIGNPADSDPPRDLNWDMWLGPAPKRPFNWNRFGVGDRWSTFRYFWDYAGGFMTDWGVHLIDIVQWAMRVEGPKVITASGGRFYLQDNAETPDTLQVTYEYPGFLCVYENRWDNGNSMHNHGYGIEFHGTDGTMFLDRDGFQVYPEERRSGGRQSSREKVERAPHIEMKSANNEHSDHVRNFLDCIKSRKPPISDIEIGHRSTSACLLGNVAYRSQERLVWDITEERLKHGPKEAHNLLSREYREPWKLEV